MKKEQKLKVKLNELTKALKEKDSQLQEILELGDKMCNLNDNMEKHIHGLSKENETLQKSEKELTDLKNKIVNEYFEKETFQRAEKLIDKEKEKLQSSIVLEVFKFGLPMIKYFLTPKPKTTQRAPIPPQNFCQETKKS